MSARRFIVTKEEDGFVLGHFEDEGYSGVYLTAEYLGHLRQIRNAVEVQLNLIKPNALPGAITNLVVAVNHLTRAHAKQMRNESATSAAVDQQAIEQVRRDLDEVAGADLDELEQARRDLEQAVKDLEKSSGTDKPSGK